MRLLIGEKVYKTYVFSFGPTCDSLDFMKGPFYLPDSVNEGIGLKFKKWEHIQLQCKQILTVSIRR